MSIQDNVLYSELPKVPEVPTEHQLSYLERDFFGQISVSQLMSNYSQLNNQNSQLLDHQGYKRPLVALCLENSVSSANASEVTKQFVEEVGLYSTLERRSLSSHYEIQDQIQADVEENYTPINQLNITDNQENIYESLIRSEDREASCRVIKVHTNDSNPIPNPPDVIYSAIHRFIPHHKDEINLLPGDKVIFIKLLPDLWIECKNCRTGKIGLVPNHYVSLFNKHKYFQPVFLKETFNANFVGSVSTRKGSGRDVAKEAMTHILSERRRMEVTSIQPVIVEITGSGVTTHVLGTSDHSESKLPPIHFPINRITYCAIQGSKSVAYIVRDGDLQNTFTCYVYETKENVDDVLDIFQKAFDLYKKSK